MNIGFWLCGVLVIPFVIIGVLFAIFKEKAAKFVSGFNSLPKEEQALYDKEIYTPYILIRIRFLQSNSICCINKINSKILL